MREKSIRLGLATMLVGALVAPACGGEDGNNNNNNNNNNNTELTKVPSNIVCDEAQSPALCTFPAGEYTEDMTFGPDRQFLLAGNVFVGAGSTLTIMPGTKIYGGAGLTALVIKPGAKIMAEGTKDKPILFTSAKANGTRGRGDWGGLIISGNAPVNCGGAGATTCEGEGNSGSYGGTDPNDNSGVLKYVTVEFAGARITDEDEYNAIAFQGVGAGTTVEYIHTHMTSDDGIEFFGGSVNAKHILVTGAGDDCLDWTFGYNGKIQFLVAQQYSDEANAGIEADNNENDNDASPRSSPMISHTTFLGASGAPESVTGWVIRRGTEVQISNSIVHNFDKCLDVDSAATFTNAQANPSKFTFSNNVFSCAGGKVFDENDEKDSMMMTIMDLFDLSDYVMTVQTGNLEADPMMPSNADLTAPSYIPNTGSAALSGGIAPSDSFFTAATYRGGVDPANDWTTGWTAYPAN
jgi:hypothetical protein